MYSEARITNNNRKESRAFAHTKSLLQKNNIHDHRNQNILQNKIIDGINAYYRKSPNSINIMQRASKWWSTNEAHTELTSVALESEPEGNFVKRENAGASDELYSTEGQAWNRAKNISLQNRPDNTVLYPNTSEKMVTNDGNRTYMTAQGSKKAVSIIITHNTDPQSQVETESSDKIKIVHAHSAQGNFPQVKKALAKGTHPKYTNNDEAKVHYLSLTPQ